MERQITMSTKEADRITVLDKLLDGQIRQKQAAEILNLSTRQIIRLKQKYQADGVKGLVHKNRGMPSNNRIDSKKLVKAMKLVKKHYHDFGPTLAHEKLVEGHQINFGVDTLRRAMITEGIWQPKRRRKPRIHQMRERRATEGELVQVDGSPHAWFEDRGDRCTLLVYIDDATSKLKHARFVESETTLAYFIATRDYLKKHGKPIAFYVDKHGVHRVNTTKGGSAATSDSNGLTQFDRAMKELGIELIFAHSPQAKGRVERVNKTLQDRLVKELRLRDINNINEGNQYLPQFIKGFNLKFAVAAKSEIDAHRPLLVTDNLDKIFTIQDTRILSKNLTCQYQNKLYLIQTKRPSYAMRHAPVLIRKDLEGKITIDYKGKLLKYINLETQPKSEVIDSKQLNLVVDKLDNGLNQKDIHLVAAKKTSWVPSKNHPWRRFAY